MNILIYPHQQYFSYADGGIVVQFYLARVLERFGQNVRIYPRNVKSLLKNSIFNKFYNNDFPIDDNTVVIYCEGIIGNPLNAPKVVRWMLSKLGQNMPSYYVKSWEKYELVYYFNSEIKFCESPEKMGSIYKLLSLIYLNPNIRQINFGKRQGICYTKRKANLIHKNGYKIVHPLNSFEITSEHTQDDCIKFFNKFEYFMSYDSNTFLIPMSGICGCIPVVYKLQGLTKQDWINTTAAAEYCKFKGIDNLYGIAYGREDMKFAKNTLHLVKEQWDDIIKFNKIQTVVPFIKDIQNFENMVNTIQNNYF
jgi:hypothetical protein